MAMSKLSMSHIQACHFHFSLRQFFKSELGFFFPLCLPLLPPPPNLWLLSLNYAKGHLDEK